MRHDRNSQNRKTVIGICGSLNIILFISILQVFGSQTIHAQVNVLTYKNDVARTGQNTQEIILTPSNVNSAQFGKLFSIAVDGYVYAQPLYAAHVNNIAGGTHNVLYVATENDTLYAIDADDGTLLWNQPFVDPKNNITPVDMSDVHCTDLVPQIGITSTPVIDLTTGTIFLVTKSKENNSFFQRLHAIDIATHAEKFGGPVSISATVKGKTHRDGSEGIVAFDPLKQFNRAGLLLENDHVVIAWASHCDIQPYHGWIMSYSASTLKQEAVFNTSPNGVESGVWMSGDAIAADSSGALYLSTGNGTYDGAAGGDYGDSIIKLSRSANGQLTVADWFTPYDQQSLETNDLDLGSGGVLLLPDLPDGSAHPHELIQMGKGISSAMGKGGTIYLLDRDNLGKFCGSCTSNNAQIVQELPGASDGIWGSPAYWNGFVYWGGGGQFSMSDTIKAWAFNADGHGRLSTSPTSVSAERFRFPTVNPVISAHGNKDGILWIVSNSAHQPNGAQILYAYDALNLGKMLYNSNQAQNNRDQAGGPVKFAVPTIANGKVYVGGSATVTAFGELNGNGGSLAGK